MGATSVVTNVADGTALYTRFGFGRFVWGWLPFGWDQTFGVGIQSRTLGLGNTSKRIHKRTWYYTNNTNMNTHILGDKTISTKSNTNTNIKFKTFILILMLFLI